MECWQCKIGQNLRKIDERISGLGDKIAEVIVNRLM